MSEYDTPIYTKSTRYSVIPLPLANSDNGESVLRKVTKVRSSGISKSHVRGEAANVANKARHVR